jgi:CBS domain-containing protein
MQRSVTTVGEEETLGRALQRMLRNDVRHLPVQRVPGGRVIGVISERDVLRAHKARPDDDVLAHPVREFMSAPVHSVHPNAPLADAAADLNAHELGCLPVIEGGVLVGLITIEDVLAVVAQLPLRRSAEGAHEQVGALMTLHPIAARADDTVVMTAAKMVRAGVRHVCVVDGDRRVIGILSDRDVRRVMGDPRNALAADVPERIAEVTVGSAMTADPRTIQEDAPLSAALDTLLTERFGALPVVDDDDRLRGILSYIDVLRHLSGTRRARGAAG